MTSRRRNKLTATKRQKFLDALIGGASIRHAAETAGIPLRTVYNWRKEDREFAKDWERAYEFGADALADEAYRRAVHGVEEPVYFQGKLVGTTRRYSDTLLMFLLKARDPLKYCDRARYTKIVAEFEAKRAEEATQHMDTAYFVDMLKRIEQSKRAAGAEDDGKLH